MGARVGNLLDDAGPLHLLTMLELGLKRSIALRCHRNLVHRSPSPSLVETKLKSRAEASSGPAAKILSLHVPSPWLVRHWIRGGRKIILQRTYLEVTPEIGLDTLRCGDGP